MKKHIFWLKQLVRPGALSFYEKLAGNQYLSPDELAAVNWAARKKILTHAYDTSPYYAHKYKISGLHPHDIKRPEDWDTIPVLSKEEIRNNFKRIISTTIAEEKLRAVSTGGSTGQPLKVLHDMRYPLEALGWRMLSWWGGHSGEDAAFCWRLQNKTRTASLVNALLWWPTRRIWIDASCISENSIHKFLKDFNRIKPAYFQGYTGAIHHVAKYILENSLPIYHPRFVWGTASPVSAVQRGDIEKAFNAPLYDQYGCCEIFWLAAECKEKRGLHVFSDARHVEFTDADGATVSPGRPGNVIITDLLNYGFPLIRYQNGDTGSALSQTCSCGITLPLISQIKGRISDSIKLPNGNIISGDYVTTLFDNYPDSVHEFQVRQHSDYSITIYAVPGTSLALLNKILEKVKNEMKTRTGGQIFISHEIVKEINSDRGKTRFIISDIRS
ncbi:MAG: phenylacetate--CoA ligase family protein [Candidatus Latescibacterota bacterium]